MLKQQQKEYVVELECDVDKTSMESLSMKTIKGIYLHCAITLNTSNGEGNIPSEDQLITPGSIHV